MASWAEDWLTRGCGPLGHTLIAIASDDEQALCCTRCDRREIAGTTTCLVCNNPGQHPAQLFRSTSEDAIAEGLLCDTCAGELCGPSPVEGWSARRTNAAPAPEAHAKKPRRADTN